MLNFILNIVVDMFLLWFIMDRFAGVSWEDRKDRLLGLAVCISLTGTMAVAVLVRSTSEPFLGLAGYFAAGTCCLWALAKFDWPNAAKVMGIFMVAKIAVSFLFQAVAGGV